MKRAWTLLALLFALPAAAQDEEQIREMVRHIRSYRTKFKVIAIGRPALPHLFAEVAGKDAYQAIEAASTIRWIVYHDKDPVGLAGILEGYTTRDRDARIRGLAADMLGELKQDSSIARLKEMLQHEEEAAVHAVQALRRFPQAAAGNILVESAAGVPDLVRDEIYAALVDRKEEGAIAALSKGAEAGHEAAIVALGETGNPAAASALYGLVGKRSDAALDALLAVGVSARDAEILNRTYGMAWGDEQKIRALGAMGESGLAQCLPAVLGAIGKPELRDEAQFVLAGIADGLGAAEAAAHYRKLLETGESARVLNRALAGYARCGEKAIEPVLRRVESEHLSVRSTAVVVLRDLPGGEATKALLEVSGRTKDPGLRRLAIRALGERRDLGSADALREKVEKTEGGERRAALAALLAVAGASPDEEAKEIYEYALGKGEVVDALMGLGRVGDETCLPLLEEHFKRSGEEERDLLLGTILDVGDRLLMAGKSAEAVRAFRFAHGNGKDCARRLRSLRERVDIPAEKGMVSDWWVIGPFAAPDTESWSREEFPEREIEIRKEYPLGDEVMRWRPASGRGEHEAVLLNYVFDRNAHVFAYAYAEIVVPEACEAILKTGSDDGCKVWVNGEAVISELRVRGMLPEEDSAGVRLKKGANTLLLKACNGGGGWSFHAKLYDKEGEPLKFVMR